MKLSKKQINFFISVAILIFILRVIYRFIFPRFGMLGGSIYILLIIAGLSVFYRIKTK